MSEPNGNQATILLVDKFNQSVRGLVVIILVLGLIYGFTVSKVVSTESYLIVMTAAITWLFKERDEEKKQKDIKDAVAASTTATVAKP